MAAVVWAKEGRSIQLATRVTRELHKRIKLAAFDSEQTLSDWVTEALAAHLERVRQKAPAAASE